MGEKGSKVARDTGLGERKIMPIFGIPIDSTRRERVIVQLERFVSGWNSAKAGQARLVPRRARLAMASSKRAWFVVTPNPEILLCALHDKELAQALRSADMSLPDGIGVLAAFKYLSFRTPRRSILTPFVLFFQGLFVGYSVFFNKKWLLGDAEVVPGRVILEEILKLAQERGWRVFLLGGREGVAVKVAAKFSIWTRVHARTADSNFQFLMKNLSSKFQITAESGPWLDQDGKPVDVRERKVEEQIVERINQFRPDFLFVGFGAPKQEKWLSRNLPKLNVQVAMVVGGAFDYLGGRVLLPPVFVEKAGLEWLWRLITQPHRLPRILNAVVVFPWEVFKWRLKFARKQITEFSAS